MEKALAEGAGAGGAHAGLRAEPRRPPEDASSVASMSSCMRSMASSFRSTTWSRRHAGDSPAPWTPAGSSAMAS